MDTAIKIARSGGAVGFVGVPHGSGSINLSRMFMSNIALHGGVALARAYIPELLKDMVAGKLDCSEVLDVTVNLNGVPPGYGAMNNKEACDSSSGRT